ncbi:putative leucine-rich repeat-containing protein DDB_G0290503 isoform X1 [Ooceraea biroi]|uniref:putative leucine-rich repeat-containing protein DDB_G0290503 isoform X1 n=1 Tax=Ooceraea biroi TaxID=2015173 RepID=UPI0005B90C5F|nr:putative leucine-rich repeat-containing protein DDB_G0290503 isoform X1 [Ooceraea biroi]
MDDNILDIETKVDRQWIEERKELRPNIHTYMRFLWNLVRFEKLNILKLEEQVSRLMLKCVDDRRKKTYLKDCDETNNRKYKEEMDILKSWYWKASALYDWTYIYNLEEQHQYKADVQKLQDAHLQDAVDRKTNQIIELQNDVTELRDVLAEDMKEIQNLRHQKSLHMDHILVLEKQLEQYNFMKTRMVELEETVTSLENYVREHDIDGLKRKLQDRECRIEQLWNQVVELKEVSKLKKNQSGKNTLETSELSDNKVKEKAKGEEIKEMGHIISEEDDKMECEQLNEIKEQNEFLKMELRKKEQKMKEMEHDISEKDNRIQKYEQQVVEQRNKILEMEKTKVELEKELHTIKLKGTDDNKKVQELEIKIHFLKNSHVERVNTIEKLIATLNEKQNIELKLRNHTECIEEEKCILKRTISKLGKSLTRSEFKEFNQKYKKIFEMENKIANLMKLHTDQITECRKCDLFYREKSCSIQKLTRLKQEIDAAIVQLNPCKSNDVETNLPKQDAHSSPLKHSSVGTIPAQTEETKKPGLEENTLSKEGKEQKDEETTKFTWDAIPRTFKKNLDDSNNRAKDCASKICSSSSTEPIASTSLEWEDSFDDQKDLSWGSCGENWDTVV